MFPFFPAVGACRRPHAIESITTGIKEHLGIGFEETNSGISIRHPLSSNMSFVSLFTSRLIPSNNHTSSSVMCSLQHCVDITTAGPSPVHTMRPKSILCVPSPYCASQVPTASPCLCCVSIPMLHVCIQAACSCCMDMDMRHRHGHSAYTGTCSMDMKMDM
jgi:hypothetical protein